MIALRLLPHLIILQLCPFVVLSQTCPKINGCCLDTSSGIMDIRTSHALDKALEKKEPITMWVGAQDTPYSNLGENIAKFMKCDEIVFTTTESAGSLRNIAALISREKDAKFAIVQRDVLEHARLFDVKFGDDELNHNDVKKYVRVVADLHTEFVHLITTPEIKTWSDLAGKRVFFGKQGSGTRFTVERILNGKKPLIPAMIDTVSNNPVESMRKGKLDAMFIVIGAPAGKLAKDLLNNEENYNLLPTYALSDKPSTYEKVSISANAYAGLKKDVVTYGVAASLITYAWEKEMEDKDSFKEYCRITRELESSLQSDIGTLKRLAMPSNNEDNWALVDQNWLTVDLDRTFGTKGITPRSECIAE